MRRIALLVALGSLACSKDSVIERRSAIEHGRVVFQDPGASDSSFNSFSCSTCHRASDDPTDARILPGAPMGGVTERSSYWAKQEPDLLRAINDCRYYFMSAQKPWTGNEEEAKVLYDYLASLRMSNTGAVPFTVPPTAIDVSAGDSTRGSDVFARSCKSCHGDAHSGAGRLASRIPVLPEESVASFRKYGFDTIQTRLSFIEKVRHGGFLQLYGNMPPYSKEALSDEDLGALLAHLGLY